MSYPSIHEENGNWSFFFPYFFSNTRLFRFPSKNRNCLCKAGCGRKDLGWKYSCKFCSGPGRLFRFDENRKRIVVLRYLTLPNGMGWSPNNEVFYFIDSLNYVVWAFDFDLENGEISNKQEFHRFLPTAGVPDGMCVDAEGNLFIAMWGGAAIEVLSPKGETIKTIGLPVPKPTSCTLTGISGLDLIVTTSSRGIDFNVEPLAGRLLALSGSFT